MAKKHSSDDNILFDDARQRFINYAHYHGVSRANGCPVRGFDGIQGVWCKYNPKTGHRDHVSIPGLVADGSLTWGNALDILWKEFKVSEALAKRLFPEYD